MKETLSTYRYNMKSNFFLKNTNILTFKLNVLQSNTGVDLIIIGTN